jgi:hypothetical protein
LLVEAPGGRRSCVSHALRSLLIDRLLPSGFHARRPFYIILPIFRKISSWTCFVVCS